MYTSSASLPLSTRLGVWGFHLLHPHIESRAAKKKTGAPVIETEAARATSSSSTCSTATSPSLSPRLSCTDLPSLAHGLRLLGHPSTSIRISPDNLAVPGHAPSCRPRVEYCPGTCSERYREQTDFHRRHRLLSRLVSSRLLTPSLTPHSRLLSPGSLQFDVAMSFARGNWNGQTTPRVHDKGQGTGALRTSWGCEVGCVVSSLVNRGCLDGTS